MELVEGPATDLPEREVVSGSRECPVDIRERAERVTPLSKGLRSKSGGD